MLLALLTVGGLVRCLQAGASDKPPSWLRPAVLSSAPFAMFVFTWHGAPMYLILAGAMMLAAATVDIKHDRPARPLITSCFRYGMGLLITTGLLGWLFPMLLLNESLWRKTLLGAIVLAVGPGLYMLAGGQRYDEGSSHGRRPSSVCCCQCCWALRFSPSSLNIVSWPVL